ncbi:MAG: hypothetical protein ACE5G8_14645 [Anaerolineae bacterium]
MTTEPQSSVDIGAVEGGIHGSQIAGRDIVQNIIVVGQFLDFAKIEGLLPQEAGVASLPDLSAGVETALRQHLGSSMAQATATVGQLLKGILQQWKPAAGAAFPFKRMLPQMAPMLVEQLKALDYWDTFVQTKYSARYKTQCQILTLDALNRFWRKHNADDEPFALAQAGEAVGFAVVVSAPAPDIRFIHTPREPHLSRFATMSNRQFRVFMAGLVLDLIRLASTAAADVKFWGDLVELVGPKPD